MLELEQEQEQHFKTRRVYLFMRIAADGCVEVGLFDQDWFEGDDWRLGQFFDDDDALGEHSNWRAVIRLLALEGTLVDTGRRKPASSGRDAVVYMRPGADAKGARHGAKRSKSAK